MDFNLVITMSIFIFHETNFSYYKKLQLFDTGDNCMLNYDTL